MATRLVVMVEVVGGGYVPVIEYSPGNERQQAEAAAVVKILRAVSGIASFVQPLTEDGDCDDSR